MAPSPPRRPSHWDTRRAQGTRGHPIRSMPPESMDRFRAPRPTGASPSPKGPLDSPRPRPRIALLLPCAPPASAQPPLARSAKGPGVRMGRGQEASQPPTDGRCGLGASRATASIEAEALPVRSKGLKEGVTGHQLCAIAERGHDADAEEERGRPAAAAVHVDGLEGPSQRWLRETGRRLASVWVVG